MASWTQPVVSAYEADEALTLIDMIQYDQWISGLSNDHIGPEWVRVRFVLCPCSLFVCDDDDMSNVVYVNAVQCGIRQTHEVARSKRQKVEWWFVTSRLRLIPRSQKVVCRVPSTDENFRLVSSENGNFARRDFHVAVDLHQLRISRCKRTRIHENFLCIEWSLTHTFEYTDWHQTASLRN